MVSEDDVRIAEKSESHQICILRTPIVRLKFFGNFYGIYWDTDFSLNQFLNKLRALLRSTRPIDPTTYQEFLDGVVCLRVHAKKGAKKVKRLRFYWMMKCCVP